jgi:hypothetical protein
MPNYSPNTHAPGQTTYRPQHLHGERDLTAPAARSVPNLRFFMKFRAPWALKDNLEIRVNRVRETM